MAKPATGIIHIVDYPQSNPWIENQIMYFLSHGIHQGIISIDCEGGLIENLKNKEISDIYKCQFGLIGVLSVGRKLRRFHKEKTLILFAHGHKPSIMAFMLNKVFGIEYVIAHHHPPNWIDLFQRNQRIKGKLHQILRDHYYKNALAIQAFSFEVEDYLAKNSHCNAKVLKIPLGVEFKEFSKSKLVGKKKEEFKKSLRILTVSRLAWEKRIHLGLEIAAILSKLNFEFEYTIVGQGPLLQELVELRNNLGLREKVHFTGWVDEIVKYYGESDLLLHLSETESFGQVLVEARLHGLTVLTTPCGIAIDLAKTPDENFFILSALTPEYVAAEIIRFGDSHGIDNNQEEASELYRDHEFYTVQEKLRASFEELFQNLNSNLS